MANLLCQVRFDSHHAVAVTGLLISTSNNPQSFDDFTKFPNGTAMPFAKNFFQVRRTFAQQIRAWSS